MKICFSFFLIFFLSCNRIFAQQNITIKKINSSIKIDGILDESEWKQSEIATRFTQHFPTDTTGAQEQTKVRVLYNDDFIFIGIECLDNSSKRFVIQSLKRDFSCQENDVLSVFINPSNDKKIGYCFAVTPYGTQCEAQISGGGPGSFNGSWNTQWFSASKIEDGEWTAEMAIPFKSVRFNPNDSTWSINFVRNNLKLNEITSWNRIPKEYEMSSLEFTGRLHWENPPKKTGGSFIFKPYAISNGSQDFSAQENFKTKFNGGLDSKISVTSSLTLDLTFNSDFSQTEVDEQQTNLTRFDIFIPEQRDFFLENSDLFGSFGFMQIRPFFSRRIGLSETGDYDFQTIPILAGARLSGKLNNNLRIGAMSVQTEGVYGFKSQNYSVGAFQQNISARHSISGIFVNRQTFSSDAKILFGDFNRVGGVDYKYVSNNSKWRAHTFFHKSFTPGIHSSDLAHAVFAMYNSRKLFFMYNHEYVESNYNAEVGFVQRTNYFRLEPFGIFKMFPKKINVVNEYQIEFYGSLYYTLHLHPNDINLKPSFIVKFSNTSEFEIGYAQRYEELPDSFSITDKIIFPNGNYNFYYTYIEYGSDFRKKFFYKGELNYGDFYDGIKLTLSAGLHYRVQPWGSFGIAAERNQFTRSGITDEQYLIGPKIEISFTKNIFWTTFIQYNDEIDNVNINSRFQWRYKSMSDFYIVYTDNYLSEDFSAKERAIVLKFTYWMGL